MSAASPPPEIPEKWVSCPQCGGPSLYAASNRFRPFCSERCKQIDLGAWASEQFAVPTQPGSDDLLAEGH
ncbi:DNA gyrase inhibitor YacG [Rhodoferax fermentans]|uniref:DNA gyrase inhibitor YacG n=1 Tax=Rhodoferax fermentans TaxID=28066 RepID=A0A1T1AX83_RHOFE|nr:DNA gyrase inhibitor YacG [Rhodoferax fermentans]MBK1684059.1 DNA gyrase inhibitor YacG [Rhodoferax fermentans]OOV08593.1 DNA gyrase inhibitor YacG [Rhodoferax fermentans]